MVSFLGHSTELQACDSEPCRNGAYCQQMEVTGDVSFQCRCTPGWSGRWCHLPTPRSPCQVSQPCHNGGVCLDDALSPHGFFCQCPSGWTGLFCQTRELLRTKTWIYQVHTLHKFPIFLHFYWSTIKS